MEKAIYTDYRGEKSVVGFKESIQWKITKDCGGPKKDGEVIVSDGKGNISRAYCTGVNKTGAELFAEILDHGFEHGACFSDTREELTNDDLIWLYQEYAVWYEIEEGWTDCGNMNHLTILRGGDIPKYFLDSDLHGPIDEEIDNYASFDVGIDYLTD